MTLRVSNTLTGELEAFEPVGDEVRLYVCGLTVSDPAHVGHARVWIHADVMRRWLEHTGHVVRHVENFTDVNEKIVARIGENDLGDTEPAVARHYIERTIADMRSLNLRRAAVYPRVSEHIPQIIDLVERLLERGHAYEANGSVYFDVTSFEGYGTLSNQRIAELEAQGDSADRSEKRNPADFALWKAGGLTDDDVREHRHEAAAPPDVAAAGAQTWASPWGEGRPGWHIECSAMATTHLGDSIDIHIGGQDLVFPHHENEIAQSEAATGDPFAKYWLHVGLLETAGEKMSSSLGNFLTVRESVAEYGANVVRTFLLSASYGQRQTLSEETIAEARKRWERLEQAHDRAVRTADSVAARTQAEDTSLRAAVDDAREAFGRAMNDDFNSRAAMTALLELGGAVNRHVDDRESFDYRGLRRAIETLEELGGGVLGLTFQADTGATWMVTELVDLVLEIREAERDAGNFERADALRASLESVGIEVQDTENGPTYRL